MVGAAVPNTVSSSLLRSKSDPVRNPRMTRGRLDGKWKLICQSGQASLYGGPLAQIIGGDEEHLFP
jgi:hypothetical protein